MILHLHLKTLRLAYSNSLQAFDTTKKQSSHTVCKNRSLPLVKFNKMNSWRMLLKNVKTNDRQQFKALINSLSAWLVSILATVIQHEYALVTIKNNWMLSQKSQLISISISFGWKQGYESSVCLSGVNTHKWRENPQITMQNFPLISHVITPSFIKYTILFTVCFLIPRSQKSLEKLGGG